MDESSNSVTGAQVENIIFHNRNLWNVETDLRKIASHREIGTDYQRQATLEIVEMIASFKFNGDHCGKKV
jgi:hypothetical protein